VGRQGNAAKADTRQMQVTKKENLKGQPDPVYGSEHALYRHLSLIFQLPTKRVRLA